MTPRERANLLRQQLDGSTFSCDADMTDLIERAIDAAVREEREACAKVATETPFAPSTPYHLAEFRSLICTAIRARNEVKP